ncbi:hypothetical protein LGQ02_01585 [Bacillus shivajii]|uniref:hypothetical protein n=1 Tax=Bacillus shivajii TaxID=1983719 RepID=UPI001CF948A3|nr:hypothetical protein [Bacillus shivajii]UCZ53519.1 hypothetical protein LGQ02_01585 [Bacillus shivajii]
MKVDGNLISGQFDEQTNEFTLQQVKDLETETRLNEQQCNTLAKYLNQHKDDTEGQVLTLYDQLLVRLNQKEMNEFVTDLEKIQSFYH